MLTQFVKIKLLKIIWPKHYNPGRPEHLGGPRQVQFKGPPIAIHAEAIAHYWTIHTQH